MSDKWYYTHETAIHGPVSGGALRQLLRTGGLCPTDMVWPEGEGQATAVPAAALSWIAKQANRASTQVASASPPAVPDWLSELAEAHESGADTSPPTDPSPESWLSDIRRSEGPQPPPLKEEVSPEAASPDVAPFYEETPRRRGIWLGRIPRRFVFIGLGLIVEAVIILLLLTCWPDKEQKKGPPTHTTQRGR